MQTERVDMIIDSDLKEALRSLASKKRRSISSLMKEASMEDFKEEFAKLPAQHLIGGKTL